MKTASRFKVRVGRETDQWRTWRGRSSHMSFLYRCWCTDSRHGKDYVPHRRRQRPWRRRLQSAWLDFVHTYSYRRRRYVSSRGTAQQTRLTALPDWTTGQRHRGVFRPRRRRCCCRDRSGTSSQTRSRWVPRRRPRGRSRRASGVPRPCASGRRWRGRPARCRRCRRLCRPVAGPDGRRLDAPSAWPRRSPSVRRRRRTTAGRRAPWSTGSSESRTRRRRSCSRPTAGSERVSTGYLTSREHWRQCLWTAWTESAAEPRTDMTGTSEVVQGHRQTSSLAAVFLRHSIRQTHSSSTHAVNCSHSLRTAGLNVLTVCLRVTFHLSHFACCRICQQHGKITKLTTINNINNAQSLYRTNTFLLPICYKYKPESTWITVWPVLT